MHDDGYDSPSCSRRASLASNTDFRRKSSLAINENAEIEGNNVTIPFIPSFKMLKEVIVRVVHVLTL